MAVHGNRSGRPAAGAPPAAGRGPGLHGTGISLCGAACRRALLHEWLPALPGVVEKLAAGARVAEVGCGRGHSTSVMAQAFPRSVFHGFDARAIAIGQAREHAATTSYAGRMHFALADPVSYPAARYDLICFCAGLRDLDDPGGAAAHARAALAPDGTALVAEHAGDEAATVERWLQDLLHGAGFTRAGRAARSPQHLVFGARP